MISNGKTKDSEVNCDIHILNLMIFLTNYSRSQKINFVHFKRLYY
jgi:hypothetical protein